MPTVEISRIYTTLEISLLLQPKIAVTMQMRFLGSKSSNISHRNATADPAGEHTALIPHTA